MTDHVERRSLYCAATMSAASSGTNGSDSSSPKERSRVLRRVRDRSRIGKKASRRKSVVVSRRSRNVVQPSRAAIPDSLTTDRRQASLRIPPDTSVHPDPQSPSDVLVAMDCEMVSTRKGSALAHCTILSYDGEILFHEYVRPNDLILDYRTRWSGILPHHMKRALLHDDAVARIKRILDGKICIGHDLSQDFSVIGLTYERERTRDTVCFKPLRTLAGLVSDRHPSLRNLALRLLDREIQIGCHDSLEDARAALDLYRKHENMWESYLVEQNWDKAVWLQDQYWPQEIVAQC